MPQQPDAVYAPQIEVDDSKKYVLKLVAIDEQPSKFRDRRKDAMSLVHRFLVYDQESGVAIEDEATGELYEQWMFTNDATYDNPTSGKIAPAREVANALCGKRLSDDEVKAMIATGWASALVGKMAVADLEWQTTDSGTERLRVLRLKPYVTKKLEPEPATATAPAAPRLHASRRLDPVADPDELPF